MSRRRRCPSRGQHDGHPGRALHRELPRGFVVVLIGLRITQLWRVNEWLPVLLQAFAMTKQAKSLPKTPC